MLTLSSPWPPSCPGASNCAQHAASTSCARASYAPPVAPELGRAFATACTDDSFITTTTLHDATIALVARLKRNGLPPERVVIAIKSALARYGGCRVQPSFDEEIEGHLEHRQATTYRLVFSWALDAYFGAA